MKKHIIPLIALSLLASSCGQGTSSIPSSKAPSSEPSSEPTSIPHSEPTSTPSLTPSSEPTSIHSSDPTSTPTSESSDKEAVGLKEAKEKCLALTGEESAQGMIFGEDRASFDARVYFIESSICSKSGSGNMYWAFAVNEEGYMYVAIDEQDYSTASKYKGQDNQYFHIEGTLSLSYGTPIIQVDKWDFLSTPTFTIDNATLDKFVSPKKSLETIYSEIKTSRINSKGVYYGDLSHFEGVYVAKMDDSVLLFSDGLKTIKLHGSNKIGNSFTLGSSYEVYGVPSEYQYCPGFEYVSRKQIEKEISLPEASKSSNAASTYNWKYENDTTKHQTTYENVFGDLYTFEGYVNYYQKDSAYYFVLTDTLVENPYGAYTSAVSDKALFVKNASETNIKYDSDLKNSLLYPYYQNSQKISLTFSPYLWNTQKYFQAYLLSDTIPPLGE